MQWNLYIYENDNPPANNRSQLYQLLLIAGVTHNLIQDIIHLSAKHSGNALPFPQIISGATIVKLNSSNIEIHLEPFTTSKITNNAKVQYITSTYHMEYL